MFIQNNTTNTNRKNEIRCEFFFIFLLKCVCIICRWKKTNQYFFKMIFQFSLQMGGRPPLRSVSSFMRFTENASLLYSNISRYNCN